MLWVVSTFTSASVGRAKIMFCVCCCSFGSPGLAPDRLQDWLAPNWQKTIFPKHCFHAKIRVGLKRVAMQQKKTKNDGSLTQLLPSTIPRLRLSRRTLPRRIGRRGHQSSDIDIQEDPEADAEAEAAPEADAEAQAAPEAAAGDPPTLRSLRAGEAAPEDVMLERTRH
jgi:hypothetical protein